MLLSTAISDDEYLSLSLHLSESQGAGRSIAKSLSLALFWLTQFIFRLINMVCVLLYVFTAVLKLNSVVLFLSLSLLVVIAPGLLLLRLYY